MNPRIASIENLIASDPGGRNIFGLVRTDQLRLAAQSLRWAKRVVIISGFYIPEAGASETDGPPGAKVLGDALARIGIPVDHVTDGWNERIYRALGLEPGILNDVRSIHEFLDRTHPSHVVAIERVGRGVDGRYRNMRGLDITATTAPLDELVLESSRRGLTTIGIGDGGNEIGMGKVFAETLAAIAQGPAIASTVPTDFCIVAGVSNWGAYGVAAALSVLENRDLLPPAGEVLDDLRRAVEHGGAVDGVTLQPEPTVDSLDLAASVRMLESLRGHIRESALASGRALRAGVIGYGASGRAAARLLMKHGHSVLISDEGTVMLEPDMIVVGVETGRHSIEFLGSCDLVVQSPGVRRDHPILDALHERGIPVLSELELAFQVSDAPLIAVTGTIGKRSTVEWMQRLFHACGKKMIIGGNKGQPLSSLLLDLYSAGVRPEATGAPCIALAVSSFQLETVVHFRPHIAIFLNLDEAHLDRHVSLADYARIKSRIFMNQRPDDVLILNLDDPRVRCLARKHSGRTFFVSSRQTVDRGAWLLEDHLFMNMDGETAEIGPARPEHPENVLCALVAARLCGVAVDDLRRSCSQWSDCRASGNGDATP